MKIVQMIVAGLLMIAVTVFAGYGPSPDQLLVQRLQRVIEDPAEVSRIMELPRATNIDIAASNMAYGQQLWMDPNDPDVRIAIILTVTNECPDGARCVTGEELFNYTGGKK